MKVSYNNFTLSDLGEVTITQKREFEGGSDSQAPQRAKVTLAVKVMLFQRSYADNYAQLNLAKAACAIPNALLVWQNDDTGETYVSQTATLMTEDFPEEWGTYYQEINLSFCYYENLDTSAQNLPLTFVVDGGPTINFSTVTGWSEGASTERFSTLRKNRRETRGALQVKGWILGDPTLSLPARRAALAPQVAALRTAMNSAQGLLTFGTGAQQMFNNEVRITEFKADVNQAVAQIEFSFSATYTLFPDEDDYATVEANISETDNMSGEVTLAVSGKVLATDETTARAKLAALVPAILKQYGYEAGQLLELEATPNLISANADGDTFTELSFAGHWRKWRLTNQTATFQKTGSGGAPVSFGNVKTWIDHYTATRFDDLRDQRRLATNSIEVGGTFAGNPNLGLAARRAALLNLQRTMKAQVNSKSGTLIYGTFSQAVRVDEFRAEVNQAETGIDWTLKAHYTLYPNEDSYATVEATFAESDNFTGELTLAASGKIQACDEGTARAKLKAVIAAGLAQYGYTKLAGSVTGAPGQYQTLQFEVTPNLISANDDGDTFTELTFTGRWRRFKASNQQAAYTPAGATVATLGNVRAWSSHYTATRFNLLRGQRERGVVDLEAAGTFTGDMALAVADRRAQLIAAQTAMLAAANSADGVLAYGVFSQSVRLDDFKADINQAETGIDWTIRAHYTLFPNEANYATVEANFSETDNKTGELVLALSGRVQATDEPTARTKVAAVVKAALAQYNYAAGQQLEFSVTPNLISANADGDTFTELAFGGRWRKWSKENQAATYQGTSPEPLSLGNVKAWTDHYTASRFNSMRDQRERAQVEIEVGGTLAGDATLALADRRAALIVMQQALKAEVNGPSGTLVYGAEFSQIVRVDDFKAEINQAITGIDWSLRAHYTLFPNESNYATVEATAEEKINFTGEQTLNVNGKIQSTSETIARTKLAATLASFLAQYGYDGKSGQAQQLELNVTPNQISANADGVTFTELTFTGSWRKWLLTNQAATFTATGNKVAVPFGNVRMWEDGYKADRFDVMRSERRHATGMVSASGTYAANGTMALKDRRAALLAMQRKMKAECDNAEGTLVYGDWSQVVRIEEFIAHVNQAETGIDWAFTASYSLFPNEGGYATCEFTADVRNDVETGDSFLTFAGDIQAPNGALARAKLASLRTATLGIYGFAAGQMVRQDSSTREISANGDATSTVAEGMETAGDVPGVSFLRLTFSEEYRGRMPGQVLSSTYTITPRDDTGTGLRLTTFAGSVTATGATADVALAAALTRAMVIGANKQLTIDPGAFLKSQSMTIEKRQTSPTVPEEFVRVSFSYEYQSKIGAGRAYMEMNTGVTQDAFGPDSEAVSGFIIAVDFVTAAAIYQQQVKSLYTGRLIRSETTTQSQVQAETPTSSGGDSMAFTAQQTRFEFTFTAHRAKTPGRVTASYAITVQREWRTLKKTCRLHGSLYAQDRPTAETFLLTLTSLFGQLVTSNREEDHAYTPEAGAVMIKLDFDDLYEDRLTGQAGVIEMQVTESVIYSGTRWAVQPVPFTDGTAGGVSIPQPAGLTEGSRTVRGWVSSASLATAQAWAGRHQSMLTGDNDGGFYPQPPKIETQFDFAPRVDGIAVDGLAGSGSANNVQIYRVNFEFSEILPNYLPVV